jgi:hypothetical protein
MNIKPLLISNGQPAEVVEPSKCALHYPAVPSQLLTALDASPRNPRDNASLTKSESVLLRVIPFVSMYFDRTKAWSASSSVQRRNGIYHLLQHRRVSHIRSGALYGQRYSSAFDHKMALRAWFSLIRRVLACSLLPFFTPLAGMVAESSETLDQPISPASLSLSSSSLCSFFHTPAFCQSLTRRQQVIPEPQPISCGSISHCKPDLSTKIMPVRAARSGTRGRPPFGLGGSFGKSGSMISHSSSGTSSLLIPNYYRKSRATFC